MKLCDAPASQSRDSIKDIWGERAPYKHEWPVRVDEAKDEEPEDWVQSACVMCSNGCGLDIGVKDGKVVGVRGRAVDRVNKGRLGPKGLHRLVNQCTETKFAAGITVALVGRPCTTKTVLRIP